VIVDENTDFDWEEKIESFRKMLGLIAEGGRKSLKVETCAMHQNIGYYEVISNY
jgi:hypothetical protein